MSTQQPNGDPSGDAVNITLTRAQRDYLREILFDDLRNWAESLAEQAHAAAESPDTIHPVDARNTFARRDRPNAELLDIIGWGGRAHGEETDR